jgi:hypothetical protein
MADSLTIDQKYEVLPAYRDSPEAGEQVLIQCSLGILQEEVADKFGVSPSSRTLSRVWIGRDQWKSAQARKAGSSSEDCPLHDRELR